MPSTINKRPYFSIEKRIRQDIELLLSVDEEFIKDVREVRKKHGIPPEGTDHEFPVIDMTDDEFVADVRMIRGKYNLSEAYEELLHMFIKSEKLGDMYTANSLWHLRPFQIINPENPDEKIVAIKLFPETTLTDIVDYWPDIEQHRNWLLELREGYENKRQSRRKNLKRDIYIYNLKKEGKTAPQIRDIINVDERFSKQKISYQDVSIIIKRLKDEVEEIIFGKYEEGIYENDDI